MIVKKPGFFLWSLQLLLHTVRLKISDFPKWGKYRHTAHYRIQKGEKKQETKLERRNSTSLHDRWGRVLSSLLWHVKCSAKCCFPTTEKTTDLSFACVHRWRLALNVCESCNPMSVFGWRKSNPFLLLLFLLGYKSLHDGQVDMYGLVLMLLVACVLAQEGVHAHVVGVGTIHPWIPIQAGPASCHPAQWAPGLLAPHLGFGLQCVPGPRWAPSLSVKIPTCFYRHGWWHGAPSPPRFQKDCKQTAHTSKHWLGFPVPFFTQVCGFCL